MEAVARLARDRPELPSFHQGEFMYLGAVRTTGRKPTIHLYKHVDTRRYLNLDDAGHAYAFRWYPSDEIDPLSAGHDEPYQSLPDAIEQLELWLFDAERPLFRSFPPDAWPDTDARRVDGARWTQVRRRRS